MIREENRSVYRVEAREIEQYELDVRGANGRQHETHECVEQVVAQSHRQLWRREELEKQRHTKVELKTQVWHIARVERVVGRARWSRISSRRQLAPTHGTQTPQLTGEPLVRDDARG